MTATDRDPVFHLRVPAELKEQLQAAADAGHRSLNAEMLLRLRESFGREDVAQDFDARLSALEEDMREMRKALGKRR